MVRIQQSIFGAYFVLPSLTLSENDKNMIKDILIVCVFDMDLYVSLKKRRNILKENVLIFASEVL